MLASWAGKVCGVQRLESAGLDYAHMLLPAAGDWHQTLELSTSSSIV